MAKRLGRELAKIQEENLEWVSCGPVDDNILHWNATIIGEDETPYHGGVFHLDIEFPAEYPFKAPRVRFVTRIYHPNVKSDSGEICADIINNGWGPTLNALYVLNTIRSMMREPSTGSPVEPDIARQLDSDEAAFRETAAKWTQDYAS